MTPDGQAFARQAGPGRAELPARLAQEAASRGGRACDTCRPNIMADPLTWG